MCRTNIHGDRCGGNGHRGARGCGSNRGRAFWSICLFVFVCFWLVSPRKNFIFFLFLLKLLGCATTAGYGLPRRWSEKCVENMSQQSRESVRLFARWQVWEGKAWRVVFFLENNFNFFLAHLSSSLSWLLCCCWWCCYCHLIIHEDRILQRGFCSGVWRQLNGCSGTSCNSTRSSKSKSIIRFVVCFLSFSLFLSSFLLPLLTLPHSHSRTFCTHKYSLFFFCCHLIALRAILENPASAAQFLNDPEIGPLLMQFGNIVNGGGSGAPQQQQQQQ